VASGLIQTGERRIDRRCPPEELGWHRQAVLRPGRDVCVVDLSAGGALLESGGRIAPGSRAELHIFGASRRSVRGRISRSRVLRIAPLCYQAAMIFDEPLDARSSNGGG